MLLYGMAVSNMQYLSINTASVHYTIRTSGCITKNKGENTLGRQA